MIATPTFVKTWPIWKPVICKKIDDLSPTKIIDLGDNLRSIMGSTNPNLKSGKAMELSETQAMKSASGHLWESLVTWYCNLCLIGTRTVLIKKTSNVPRALIKVIEIDYDGDKSIAEADLWAITFPKKKEFTDEIPASFENKTKQKTQALRQDTKTISKSMMDYLDQITVEYFKEFELGIISCKTPWNDFAVIPEHWDLVYTLAKEMPEALSKKKISIGKDSTYSIADLKKFFYAFATLPSQEPIKFSNPKTLPIIRLKQLSGGNYWGLPSQTGVQSVKEIFKKNFLSSVGTEHLQKLEQELKNLKKIMHTLNYD